MSISATSAASTFALDREEFTKHFDLLLHAAAARATLQMVAAAISAALASQGFVPGEWAPEPATRQTFEVRTVQWDAPFTDPTTGQGFTASVRLFAFNAGGFHRASVWGDLCRNGEVRSDPDSVCQSVLDATWDGLSQSAAGEALSAQMAAWGLPPSVEATRVRAAGLAADLTTILAP